MNHTPHPAQLLFSDTHPLTAALDMHFDGVVDGVLTVRLSGPESFADSDGTSVHTGFATLFLDTVMGACAIGELTEFVPIATVKLNCNHLKKIAVGQSVLCRAHQTGQANGMAYISGEVVVEQTQEILATAIGTFMIGTASKPLQANQ